jgi:hypothetical protein
MVAPETVNANLARRSFHSFVTVAFPTRCKFRASVAGMTKTTTPWGPATLVEQLRLPQQVGDKRFASVVELLQNDRGERLVRFAYSTDGTTRRGPVTLRERDVTRLRKELAKKPGLAEALADAIDAEGA